MGLGSRDGSENNCSQNVLYTSVVARVTSCGQPQKKQGYTPTAVRVYYIRRLGSGRMTRATFEVHLPRTQSALYIEACYARPPLSLLGAARAVCVVGCGVSLIGSEKIHLEVEEVY